MRLRNSKIPIIYYHSVGIKNAYWPKGYLTLDLPFFEDQLKYFAKKFKCISLKEHWLIQNGELTSPSNPIVLTFDDGYLDNWQFAYPLLKKYGLKGTIFVSPEFVDLKNGVRPNLEDVWNGKATMDNLKQWGFLSWDEMRLMEQSGVMDIQSHTMTHTKYFVSDKLIGFHHPSADSLYYIGNNNKERKPYYISDSEFEKLLPYGYPIFEMKSAVVARKVEFNQEFINFSVDSLANYNLSRYSFADSFARVKGRYDELKASNKLITYTETDEEYNGRLRYEIFESKRIIEDKLNKKVEFLCWPHGDNNELAHKLAMEAGYLATSLGKMPSEHLNGLRFDRYGLGVVRNNRLLSLLKAHYKTQSYRGKQPYCGVKKLYEFFRDL